MKQEIIANYVDKIYTYALTKTFSVSEAEELSQEILLTAITSLPKLRDMGRFEPWLWGLAANVTKSFSRNMGRQRAMFVYNAPEEMLEFPVLEEEDEELYSMLREKIAMLTKLYRDIIILHYYDGLSTKQIAETLGIPEGTITWRLAKARQKLKKECGHMEESALRPAKLRLDIYGSGDYDGKKIPFPSAFIDDSLSQNILVLCSSEAKSIEELAKHSGVPAYYIEERIQNLENRCAVFEPVKGKYLTDFIIYDDRHGKYCEENAQAALAPILPKLADAMKQFFGEIKKLDFYRAEKSDDEINYLCGILAFDVLCAKYNHTALPSTKIGDITYPEIPANYDGQKWRYVGFMESGKYHRIGIGHQTISGSFGDCRHDVFGLRGFGFRNMMPSLYLCVCERILFGNAADADEYNLANAVKDGYIVRQGDGFFVTVPAFTMEQKMKFNQLADACFAPLMPEYVELVAQFARGYKKLFPKHLVDDVSRMCYQFFLGFYDTISEYGQKTGLLAAPKKEWVCDVITQWKA